MQSNDIDFLDLLNGQVQYVVPRWQRRYRWGRSDIERLVQDLLAVAAAGEEIRPLRGHASHVPRAWPGRRREDDSRSRWSAAVDDGQASYLPASQRSSVRTGNVESGRRRSFATTG